MSGDAVRALLETVPNPFREVRVDSAWDTPPIDVTTINLSAFRDAVSAVDEAAGRTCIGLLLHGEPGAGKTHLLARLRHWLQDSEKGWFVYVLPLSAPDRFFRHLLRALVSDIVRPPREHDTSQIEVAIARQFMADASAPAAATRRWWDAVRAQHPEGEALAGFLKNLLAPVARVHDLDPDVLGVLVHYLARVQRSAAQSWLLGRAVTEAQAEALGVGSTLDDEDEAKTAVVTLLRLAGASMTVVLAFDQIEGLVVEKGDTRGLIAYGNGIADLFARCHSLVAITCARTDFLNTLGSAVGEAIYDGRLREREARLERLITPDALTLAERRVKRDTDLQAVRMFLQSRVPDDASLRDTLWPLSTQVVRDVVTGQGGQITSRKLLLDCRAAFDERRTRRPPPAETLNDRWEQVYRGQIVKPQPKIDEATYADGLLRVFAACPGLGVRAERSRIKDVDLLVGRGGRTIGVAVCHAEHMTSLAARLRRLASVQPLVDRLVVLRDQRLTISPKAARTAEHLRALEARGALLVKPPAEAYAALDAIRELLDDAAAGDLNLEGRAESVPPEELKDWLAGHLPLQIADLCETLLAEERENHDPRLERLQELLQRRFLVPVAEAAEEIGIPAEDLAEVAAANARVVGHIEGDPGLLFLHLDGAEHV